ncbi:S8 family peptidase [Ruegeria atlantica]|uniref:S8 family peptidase n=1 Tax=Ruegeria atlantica TaxID=81569 RepID=UPI0014806EA1|nr:S8 family peptidase [Ruegeria atlantica]
MAASLTAVDDRKRDADRLAARAEADDGVFVTVELDPRAKGAVVQPPSEGSRQSSEIYTEDGRHTVVLHIPDESARDKLIAAVEKYAVGDLSEKTGRAPLATRMEPIEGFQATEISDLWRDDPAQLPTADEPPAWWALWCWEDFADDVVQVAERLEMTVAPRDRWSHFPDVVVVPVKATYEQIQVLINLGQPGLAELGRATDDPAVLVELSGQDQDALVNDLANRVIWPGADVPAICLLDTGVNRGHPLIEPALSSADAQAVDPLWGDDDHHRPGHGTPMAGLALHGDLTGPLADASTHELKHRLESVKVLPPDNLARRDGEDVNYAAIIEQAVSKAEERNPARRRTICSAVTNRNRIGDRATLWSSAIDGIAAGADAAEDEEPPRRLFIQAIGNIPHNSNWPEIEDPTEHSGEDPSQAWNALTVGGVTFKDEIAPRDRAEWSAGVEVGHASPYGRTSCHWPDGTLPIKPEVVFEAGNRAVNLLGDDVVDGMATLSDVSTGKGGARDAVMPFYATSGATAHASRMAARIMAEHPNYWPETVRALMVHSAKWTPQMRTEIDAQPGMTGRKALRRKFGYGVPDLRRALASASNDLALVSQAYIQPYERPGRAVRDDRPIGPVGFGSAHYYDLPWPTDLLEELENTPVSLKVTLSYFVEPYPLSGSMVDPAKYRSFGLRFDLKRKHETEGSFRRRRNAELGAKPIGDGGDEGWLFGERSVAAGSLHCDVWTGPAIELAARDRLCVYPVMGWWRDRVSLNRYHDKARYSLVVTLEAPEVEVDLQARVAATARSMIGVGTPVDVDVDIFT